MARASRRSILAEDPMTKEELELRKGIIAACRAMNSLGINQGTSGNISARYGDVMILIDTATGLGLKVAIVTTGMQSEAKGR